MTSQTRQELATHLHHDPDYGVEFTVSDQSGAHVWTYDLSPASLLEDFGRGIMTDIRFQVDSVFGPLTFTFKKVPRDTPTTSGQLTLDEADEDEDDYDDEDYVEGEDDEYDSED